MCLFHLDEITEPKPCHLLQPDFFVSYLSLLSKFPEDMDWVFINLFINCGLSETCHIWHIL